MITSYLLYEWWQEGSRQEIHSIRLFHRSDLQENRREVCIGKTSADLSYDDLMLCGYFFSFLNKVNISCMVAFSVPGSLANI